jgi:hypothetical protein
MQAAVLEHPSKQARPLGNRNNLRNHSHSCGGPICCKREMFEMIRRAILRSDGTLIFCSVWHCLNCGRLLL